MWAFLRSQDPRVWNCRSQQNPNSVSHLHAPLLSAERQRGSLNRGLYVDIYRHMWNRLRVMDSGNTLAWLGSDQWVTVSVKLSPWEIIPPWSYRHCLPGPSSVLTCHCPRALMRFMRMRATLSLLIQEGRVLKSEDGLILKSVWGLAKSWAIESLPSTCICFLIFF